MLTSNLPISGIGEKVMRREGLTETIEPWEDGLRTDVEAGYFEWWYFDAHFQDGSTVVIVFTTKSLMNRKSPLNPCLQMAITRSDGRKTSVMPFYPPAQFSAARDRCDVRIGPNWVRGDLHRYELHVEVNGMAADLTFTGQAPPWRPGAGKTYYAKDLSRYFAWLPAIPHGSAEGTLTYDGQTHPVEGAGYHDHNWGNVDLQAIMSHWYWGRAHVDDFSTIFVEMVSTKKYGQRKLPVFMLAQGDRVLTGDGRPLTLQVSDWQEHPGGRRYPRQADFHWQTEEGEIHLALRRAQLIEAVSLLNALPAWKQRALRWFTNPYYFRFNADLELHIDLGSVKTIAQGTALYEIMLLR